MIIFSVLLIPCSYLLVQIWQTITLFQYHDSMEPEPEIWPEITILVAARDEELHIGRCLTALSQLDYPHDKLHIVVGNDQSTDATGEIANQFSKQHAFIKVVDIAEDNEGLKAKARVMAQLDKHALGDFYLVTDADVTVKPAWAKSMVRHMKPETGVASGTTMVAENGIWGNLQGIDWAYFMGLLNVISYSGVPATAVGNNMIIRKEAYWQTGGYGAIKFSITEDYKLYSEVCKFGWKWNNIMIPDVLAYSASTNGFFPLLHQRKRWLSGGKELPWYWWLLFGVFGLYYFFIPVALYIEPKYAGVVMLFKFVFQTVQINRIYSCVGEKRPSILHHIGYELYLFAVTISTALFFVFPIKTEWKGRKY
jgi:cellulose synthase/poly-beta-1,6-N-acetylglucosamine synthase-like glycosyltransferase